MTDPSDSLSLAEQGAAQRDLPPPPPLRIAPRTALFLDFDGTLVDIADRPDEVVVPNGLPKMIKELADRLDGRLAIVTGRSLTALDALLGPLPVAVAGSHGGEFRPAGSNAVRALAEPLPAVVAEALVAFAKANGGLLVEAKPFSMAVHYRRHPSVFDNLLTCAEGIASEYGLAVKHGKQVIELVMPGSNKDNAVIQFMERPEFAGTLPQFVGDDMTDEDAFHAVIGFGGGGVLVGHMRPTAARWRLENVAAVHSWLSSALIAGEEA